MLCSIQPKPWLDAISPLSTQNIFLELFDLKTYIFFFFSLNHSDFHSKEWRALRLSTDTLECPSRQELLMLFPTHPSHPIAPTTLPSVFSSPAQRRLSRDVAAKSRDPYKKGQGCKDTPVPCATTWVYGTVMVAGVQGQRPACQAT